MATYKIIKTQLKKDGKPRKLQKVDRFRKMLKQQKIKFKEREVKNTIEIIEYKTRECDSQDWTKGGKCEGFMCEYVHVCKYYKKNNWQLMNRDTTLIEFTFKKKEIKK